MNIQEFIDCRSAGTPTGREPKNPEYYATQAEGDGYREHLRHLEAAHRATFRYLGQAGLLAGFGGVVMRPAAMGEATLHGRIVRVSAQPTLAHTGTTALYGLDIVVPHEGAMAPYAEGDSDFFGRWQVGAHGQDLRRGEVADMGEFVQLYDIVAAQAALQGPRG